MYVLSASVFLIIAVTSFGCSTGPRVTPPPTPVGVAATPNTVVDTSLPTYAQPTGRILDPADYDGTDVISYRLLRRSDFKGTDPPNELTPYRDRLGATTCAYIVTSAETQVFVRPIRGPSRRVLYEATPQNLGFRAQMDRGCSWWNSAQEALQTDYILEHEQIHFALFELEARRLNAAVAGLYGVLKTTDSTMQGARQGVQSRLEDVLAESLRGVLARSRSFDEETSMGYRPIQQKACYVAYRPSCLTPSWPSNGMFKKAAQQRSQEHVPGASLLTRHAQWFQDD